MFNLNHIIVTRVKEIFTVASPKGRFEKIQNRKCYGLSFCYDGQITYTHKDRKIVSDKHHAILLPQGQTYTISGDKTGSFPVINFTCANTLCDTVIALPLQNTAAYLSDFEKIKSLSLFGGNSAEIMSIFYHILYRLSTQNTPCGMIMPAIKYLESHYQEPDLTNTVLAQQCNISEIYFRRIFTEHYKMTPKQFLIDVRINKAKQLLSEGTLKINAIAAQCGFSNQYHFCRLFKEKTGLTPTDYMQQNRIYKI